jgi:imidazolonepropionase-like amidohydrolase
VGAGADVIKVYADYRKRALRWPLPSWPGCAPIQFPPKGSGWAAAAAATTEPSERNPNLVMFADEEMRALVAEARRNGLPVAAHAGSAAAVFQAAKAGVTSVEHGNEGDEGAVAAMKENGTIYVPTLATIEAVGSPEQLKHSQELTALAYKSGVTLACGGDTGAFNHGQNVRELELMIDAGVPLEETLVAATINGWRACGEDMAGRSFGWWANGVAADIVALKGDPRVDPKALRNVSFVMKDGRVWKKDGVAVGMYD